MCVSKIYICTVHDCETVEKFGEVTVKLKGAYLLKRLSLTAVF